MWGFNQLINMFSEDGSLNSREDMSSCIPAKMSLILEHYPPLVGMTRVRIVNEKGDISDIASDQPHLFSFTYKKLPHNYAICTMRGNCGVAIICNIDRVEPELWNWLEGLCKFCGYGSMLCGVNVEHYRNSLINIGWKEFTTFINPRTQKRCYLMMKNL